MPANDKTGVGSGRGDWQTPPGLFKRLDDRYGFELDAFASHNNALCSTYCAIDGTYRIADPRDRPARYPSRDSDRDGFNYPWRGHRVFMNPPYSRGIIDRAVAKAYAERNNAKIIVGLLPASTDTAWFNDYIRGVATVHFLPQRVRFIDPATGEPGGSPPGGSMIVVWTPDWLPVL